MIKIQKSVFGRRSLMTKKDAINHFLYGPGSDKYMQVLKLPEVFEEV